MGGEGGGCQAAKQRGAEVLTMGTRQCGAQGHRRDNVGRVGLGTGIHQSCHSDPRTLHCAKHCSNTVIWTKNIGLSFSFLFSKYRGYFLSPILWLTRMVFYPYQSMRTLDLPWPHANMV